ncbi:MmgE/PrpD family protein [Aminobacter sp. J44]|uniref:MmgE/PrpD family protein n=1 Tax=Aminobacter sp. J44 TaxID=935262 RepID=UPI00119C22E4|nr:MmgE/PrpD family protein [Aminobacter sp. J44]TWG53210.1 2-methylcitrate dehydratase PrpD [Aminobacter sp. J44]
MSQELEYELAEQALKFAHNPPEPLLALAARHITDFIGVFLAGAEVEEMRGYLQALQVDAGLRGSVEGFTLKCALSSSAKASFLGAAAHMHDFDDDEPAVAVGHPTVAVAAAAFSTADPDADTRMVLASYLAGIEVINRLGLCVNPDHYNRGWHATATLGAFGSAATSAILRGADAGQLANALRFAASFSSGLKASFGSTAKPIQVGHAAASGVRAAAIATSGVQASPGILFGKTGWVDIQGAINKVVDAVAGFGSPHAFEEPGLNIKLYPCCSSSHTAIDGIIDIISAQKIDVDDIASIDAWIGPDIPGILIYDFPTTGLEGKFSLRYPIAIAALNGRITLSDFESDKVKAPKVVELMKRIRVHIDPTLPRAPAGVTHCSRIKVTTVEGAVSERFTLQPRGSSLLPLSTEELFEKFALCAEGVLNSGAKEAFDKLMAMPNKSQLIGVLEATRLHR